MRMNSSSEANASIYGITAPVLLSYGSGPTAIHRWHSLFVSESLGTTCDLLIANPDMIELQGDIKTSTMQFVLHHKPSKPGALSIALSLPMRIISTQ